jgi:hydrogenase nickel incorporation protein HypA/HybF
MHELAIAEGLVRTALAALKDAPPKSKVTELAVEVGELSTVVPELLKSSFDIAAEGSRLAGAKLKIKKVALVFACRGCGRKFGTGHTACPECRSTDVEIVAGREVRLLSLEVED